MTQEYGRGLIELGARIAQMQSDLKAAETANKALDWFKQHAKHLRDDLRNGWTVRVDLHFAGSCGGSDEAETYLRQAINTVATDIIDCACDQAFADLQKPFASVDRSGEAGETPKSGSTEGESATRSEAKGDAQ